MEKVVVSVLGRDIWEAREMIASFVKKVGEVCQAPGETPSGCLAALSTSGDVQELRLMALFPPVVRPP